MLQHLPSQRNFLRRMRAVFLRTVLATLLFFVPFTKAHAQADAATTSRLDCYKRNMPSMNCIFEAITNSQQTGQGNQEKFTMYSVGLMAGALGYGFAGASTSEAAGVTPGDLGSDAGAITILGRGMAFLYEKPPASLGDYVADLIQNNNLVRPAYAQGVGFQSLSNILPIWKTFRDIAYLLLTLIFFFIGFFIIFRQKLDGHTVANISNAIPNVIIALILITFSYAIAGFMIDLMYLVIYFLIWIAGQVIKDPISVYTPISGNYSVRLETIALNQNLFSSGLNLVFGTGSNDPNSAGIGSAATAVGAIVYSMFDPTSTASILAGLVGTVAQVIAFAVFAIALFFAVMRTFLSLIQSYISFIIAVIFSPLQLLMGAISGRSTFVNWIKTLIASLVPFPMVIGLIFLSMALTGFARDPAVGYRGFALNSETTVPGSAGGFNPPLLPFSYETSGAAAAAIQGIIGFGILMFMPEAVKMAKDFLKVSGGPNMDAVKEGIKRGWSGDEKLIPGVKLPGARRLGNIGLTAATGAGIAGTAGLIGGIGLGSQAKTLGKNNFGRAAAGFGGAVGGGIAGLVGGVATGGIKGAASVIAPPKLKEGEHPPTLIQRLKKLDTASPFIADIIRRRKAGTDTDKENRGNPTPSDNTQDDNAQVGAKGNP